MAVVVTRTRAWSELPLGAFSVVYADPPWSYYGAKYKDQAAAKHYSCMTLEELAALPVRSLMTKRAVLLCWATCPKLDVAIDTIRAWGLTYRGIAKVWVKTRADGAPIHGQGVRPTVTKPTAELLLVASVQKRGRPLPILDEGMAQVLLASRPGNEHSAKPASVRGDIVTLFGDVQRVELFARGVHEGWSSFGDELPFPCLTA